MADDRKGGAKIMTAEEKRAEAEKKRKEQINQSKAKKKKSESLDARMGQVVKIPKDKNAKTGNDR
jgi:hypothetical protein